MKLMSRGALDPRWTRHHTPVAASFMLATIKVIRKIPSTSGARPTYDPATRTWNVGTDSFDGEFVEQFGSSAMQVVVSSAKARIQPFGIMGDMVVGQDTTGRRLMRVQIENVETSIHLDDMIVVLDCPDNPELKAYTIEVRGAISSSNAWLTDLVCEADMKAST